MIDIKNQNFLFSNLHGFNAYWGDDISGKAGHYTMVVYPGNTGNEALLFSFKLTAPKVFFNINNSWFKRIFKEKWDNRNFSRVLKSDLSYYY